MTNRSPRDLVSKCSLRQLLGLGLLVLGISCLWLPSSAWAQHPAASVAPPESEPEAVSPRSPRRAFGEYLTLARKGLYLEAAAYLDIEASRQKDGAELAKRLHAILERHLLTDLSLISPVAGGDLDDGASALYEIVGKVPTPDGEGAPVRLRRLPGAKASPHWVFSQGTVRLIDEWHQGLKNRWMLERLPPGLLKPGPRGLLLWQWIAIPAILVLGIGVALLLGRLTRMVLAAVASRTEASWDDAAVLRMKGPLTLLWLLAILFTVMPGLDLHTQAEESASSLLRGLGLFAGFWALSRLVEAWGNAAANSEWAAGNPSARSLVPFATRVGKVVVFALGVVALISALGYPAASLLAGLGVGGLAIALAGQKTVENLFGAMSISVDQPFRVGDFVKVEDFMGTVESVGLRSTRIRTLDRTVVTLPNGRLSEMRLESFTARDRLRLFFTIGLVYDTTPDQMRLVLQGTEEILRRHPKIMSDSVDVWFKGFGDSALLVDVIGVFLTADWREFLRYRQEVLLEIMQLVASVGSGFAFPTQTIKLDMAPEMRLGALTPASRGPAPGDTGTPSELE